MMGTPGRDGGRQMQSPGDMTLRSGVIRGYSLISLRACERKHVPGADRQPPAGMDAETT